MEEIVKADNIDTVVAVGGGSAVDTAKSYSILHRQAHCYRAYSCCNRCAMYRSVSNIQ